MLVFGYIKAMGKNRNPQITVLGVGNLLFCDEGLGIRAVEILERRYHFPENVKILDGGVLGIHLLGAITEADHLIVIDAVKNGAPPGSLHRLKGKEVPKRILSKNSLHEVDLLEALTLCQAFDKVPETVIVGIEPADIERVSLDLSPPVEAKLDDLIETVIYELRALGASPTEKTEEEQRNYVSCNPC